MKVLLAFAVAAFLLVYGLLENDLFFLVAGGALLGTEVLRLSFYRTGTAWSSSSTEPRPFRVTWLDYLKLLVSWIFAFKRTYVVEPGLYYLGSEFDADAPLLVTSNYRMTVVLVARKARQANARLLVVDTDGINVWCAAGKGAFSNRAILQQLERYDRRLLTQAKWLRLVLPKFALAGVDFTALRDHKIRPIIGPLYAKDLPAYLQGSRLEDCDNDRVVFGLQSRIFTWLPGLVQAVGYGVSIVVVMTIVGRIWSVSAPLGLITLLAAVATAYPLLFPWLPGKRFAVKGISLAFLMTLALGALAGSGWLALDMLPAAIAFAFAGAIFIGLAYTGNSAVSNYSRVRKEIARFLPLNVLLFALSLVLFIALGVKP